MSDDLEFIVIDDIPEYIFCIGDDEENERVIALSGKDGAFKYEKAAELPTTGEDGVLYLVPKSHTTQTASGNPISVNITDNAGKIESLKLDGDTYQQSLTGKNLIEPKMASATSNGITCTNNGDGSFTLNGTASATATFRLDQSSLNASDNLKNYSGTYTLSCEELTSGMGLYVMQINTWTQYLVMRNSNTPVTGSVDATGIFIYVGVFAGTTINNLTIHPMFEKSATVTPYEPYVGGVPSPNPSYPQQIKTVTGTQTVSINDIDYPIDLGTIELCKLGTYQDYIYKDGDDWKVHKATAKAIFNGSESWFKSGSSTSDYLYAALVTTDMGIAYDGKASALMDEFTFMPTTAGDRNSGRFNLYNGTTVVQNITCSMDTSVTSTPEEFKTWLSTHPATLYYPLYIATDTTITDATLIAQLEAVRTAALSTGSNTISNTATGTNLAGDLEIGYYGYDPLNKYDKYFWLDVDGAYESL